MYMNGRGPMMGGHRGFGPMHHRPMGFGPMHHRPMGIFPLGGLFLLPALMFGGWLLIAVVFGLLSLGGYIFSGIFHGLSSLASGAFSGSSVAVGTAIGVIAFYLLRNRKAKKEAEGTDTVDGVEAETRVEEPTAYRYSRMGE
jgi:hypothetical protein